MLNKTITAFSSTVASLIISIFSANNATAQGTVVGSIPVDFKVSGGSANYSIPISVAPGRGGMQPQLSLSYNGNGGNGVLGVGWSLGGLSSIHRCGQTIAQDGQVRGINFNADDRYCLNGQRLIPVSGANGGVGAEYRTEIDNYSQIISHGGSANNPAYWVLKTKAGQVMTYGGVNGDATVNYPEGNLSWSLREINDTTGNNPITYNYFIDQNKQYLDEIVYATGRVDIEYELRPDVLTSGFRGSIIKSKNRVAKIGTYFNSSLIKAYSPLYESVGPNNQSRITGINLCGLENKCQQQLSVEWRNTSSWYLGTVAVNSPLNNGSFSESTQRTVTDLNNDGLNDIVWAEHGRGSNAFGLRSYVALNNGNGAFSSSVISSPMAQGSFSETAEHQVVDVNGDGIQDLVWTENGADTNAFGLRVYTSLGNANGVFSSAIISSPMANGSFSESTQRTIVDLNNDGLNDIVWAEHGKGSNAFGLRSYVALNNGNGTFSSSVISSPMAQGSFSETAEHQVVDVNGDGIQDLVWTENGADTNAFGLRVYASLGNANGVFSSAIISSPMTSGSFSTSTWRTIADLNNDGLNDIVWAEHGSGNNAFGLRSYVALNNGDGTFSSAVISSPMAQGSFSETAEYQVIDVNGDGIQDLVWTENGADTNAFGLRVYASLGNANGVFSPAIISSPMASGSFSESTQRTIADLNNDGLNDIVWAEHGSGNNAFGLRSYVALNNGDGTFLSAVISSPMAQGSFSETAEYQVIDISGDGIQDLVWTENGADTNAFGLRVYVSRNIVDIPLFNTLSQITDSNGNTTSLVYKPLTDPAVYTKSASAQFPVVDLIYPRYVVSQVDTSNGVGGTTSVQYHYEGLKANVQGRGSYGFAKITETYSDTGKTSVATYDQRGFPYTGNLLSIVESYNGDKVNESFSTFASVETYPGVYQLNLNQSVQSSYELGNDTTPVTTVTTTYENIDTYGNVGRVTTINAGAGQAFTKVADSNYTNDTTNWFLGRLSDTTVTHQSPYGNNDVRRSAFTYNSTTGLLETESILDSSSVPLTTTTYTYDSYGQKTEVRISATGEQDRVTTTSYDNTGRPTQTCNVYNQCESYTYTVEGWLDITTGPNGIATDIDYDSFGRPNRENRANGTWTSTNRYFASSGQCGELANFAYTCSVTQPSTGQPIIVQYDKLGREVRKIKTGFDGRLVYSDTQYNHLAQVSRVSRDYYSGDHTYWATSEYDPLGRVIRITEPGPHGSTNEVTYQYNGLTTTTISGPDARSKTVINNAVGQKIRIEEEEGAYVTYTYNSDGNLLTTTVNDNPDTVITLSYDEFGRKIAMDDPDMGYWTYEYNAFGQLISQTDAKTHASNIATGSSDVTVAMQYDLLGRMVSRTESEGTSTWVYGGNTAPAGSIGKLLQESGNGLTKDYSYDILGRPVSTTTTIAGEGSFTSELQYDSQGRVNRTTYPGTQGFYTENVYNNNGFLEAVTGLRAQAEAHDYSALSPLITQATTLAGSYLVKANELRTLGQYYESQIAFYQSLSGSGSVSTELENNLLQHQSQLSTTVTQGQNLSPEFLGHLNNTIDELQAVSSLITSHTQSYESIAEQLIVLAEQTLAAADHNFQFVNTLGNAADAYNDFANEGNTGSITYWRAVDVDASGRISAEVYGNGIVNDYAYNQGTGQLQSIHSSLLVVDAIRHLEYQYDAYNNVTLRDDLVNDIRDTYNYDRLDRLTSSQVNSNLYQGAELNNTQNLTYDVLGNITDKSDVGAYSYGVRPHAVTQAGSHTYVYDANGNMTSGNGRTIQYSSFNKPVQITRNGQSASFSYGPNRARYRKVNHNGDTTLYVGGYERTTRDNGNQVEQKHYIYAAGQLVAEHIISSTDGTQMRYLHKDALGSVDLVTDAYGAVVDRRSFDAWGKMRNLPWQANASLNDPLYLTQLPFTDKGYTGHEHVQEVELIHMNGRMYDATLARFVSADPHIQAGTMSQSYNRYSYVLNNPLKYTDPSGYFWKRIKKEINRSYQKIVDEARRFLRRKWVQDAGYKLSAACGAWATVCAAGHTAAIANANGGSSADSEKAFLDYLEKEGFSVNYYGVTIGVKKRDGDYGFSVGYANYSVTYYEGGDYSVGYSYSGASVSYNSEGEYNLAYAYNEYSVSYNSNGAYNVGYTNGDYSVNVNQEGAVGFTYNYKNKGSVSFDTEGNYAVDYQFDRRTIYDRVQHFDKTAFVNYKGKGYGVDASGYLSVSLSIAPRLSYSSKDKFDYDLNEDYGERYHVSYRVKSSDPYKIEYKLY